ncbi:cupin domain-containing protein [Jiangella alba]|uniref:cupin domain-containing protein n=1 Tax=Jiangella alba TaxID=561176 RepID=UPI0009F460CC
MGRATVVEQADLPVELDGSATEFEGRDHGGGEALFTVGDDEIVGRAGQIIVCPAQVPHKFAKTGTGRLEMIDVHASPVFITEWLE